MLQTPPMGGLDLGVREPEEAAAPVSTRNSVRIVGTSLPVYPLLVPTENVASGISVGQMETNKKALCIKLKLDGTKFGKLGPADANTVSERRKWSLSLYPQIHCMCIALVH